MEEGRSRSLRSTPAINPYLARSPQAAVELARFDRLWRLPILLSAVLPIVLVTRPQDALIAAINVVAWIVFVIDLVAHLRLINRYLHTKRGKVDLVIVILTAPWFLIPGFQNTVILTLARIGRLVRLVAVGPARKLFERLGRVFVVAFIVVLVCSTIAYRAEHATNPEYATFGDALWWGIVTLTTVGYGDIVPLTTTGRVAGVMIMFTGVAVLGLLAGNLASFLRLEPPSEPSTDEEPSGSSDHSELTTTVSALHDEVARLSSLVDRLATTPPTDDSGAV